MDRIAKAVPGSVREGQLAVWHARERRKFLDLYGNPVAAMLQRIYQHEDAPAIDRYLSVTMAGGPYGSVYVQCLFRGDNAFIELSSGYYAEDTPGPPKHRVPPDRLRRLAELGFTTDDSDGYFQLMQDLRDCGPQDTADLMLTALFDTYGETADADVFWDSPFVHGYDYEQFLEEGKDLSLLKFIGRTIRLFRKNPEIWSIAKRAASASPESLQLSAFVEQYTPALIPLLERARKSGLDDENRCLLLTCMPETPDTEFVRVAFHGRNEASCDCLSGYLDRETRELGKLFPRKEVEEFLAEMNFENDPEDGVLYGWLDVEDDEDLKKLATVMLYAFYLACGARVDSEIKWLCPAVDDPDTLPDACALIQPLTV